MLPNPGATTRGLWALCLGVAVAAVAAVSAIAAIALASISSGV